MLALTAALPAATVLQEAGVLVVPQERLLRLALLFLLGTCALLFADRVRLHPALGVAALTSVVAGLALLADHRALAAPGFAFLLLWAVTRAPLHRAPRADLSYGVYVYHWPIAVLLLTAGADRLPPALVVLLVAAASLAAAALSWRLVEAPALRFRSARWVTASWRRSGRRGQAKKERTASTTRSIVTSSM